MSALLDRLFGVAGKVAVVTGGAKGVGAMITRTLVEAGAEVFAVSRSAGQGEAFAAGLPGPGRCTFLAHDLTTIEGVEAAAEDLRRRAPAIHILVNNAGGFSAGPIEDARPETWDREFDLNLRAPFFLTQTLLPGLEAAATPDDPARVIFIGSIAALWAKTSGGAYAYGASKAGVHQLTRMLASDLTARGIRINAIAPGYFPSDMTDGFFQAVPGLKEQVIAAIPAGRLGAAEDIGGAVLFLASRAGAYLSGAILPIEGGIASA
jgi:NAD(P)-dependent dehydrogenase (short-subunit alcohol dehydrogenase family)